MAIDYTEEIGKYDYRALRRLWEVIRRGEDIPGWEPGKAFEYLLLRAFRLEGAEVVWPYEVELEGDVVEQIDGVIYSDGLTFLLEAKDHKENVDFAPIAKLRNQLLRRPSAVMGVVFSKHGFTEPAKILTRYTVPQRILLWEGEEITIALQKRKMCEGLKVKYRYAIERALPDYNLKVGLP